MDQPSTRRRWAAFVLMAASVLAVPSVVAVPPAAAVARSHRSHDHHGRRDHHGRHSHHGHHGHHGHGDAVVRVTKTKDFGHILETKSGQTVYVLLSKTGSPLPCSGACQTVWPPVLTHAAKLRAPKPLRSKLLGTTKSGKRHQVAYDHHPLFRYRGDTSKGQTNGEDIKSYGGEWYVIGPNGKPVKAAVTASKGKSGSSGGYGGSGGYGSSKSSGGSGGGW